MTDDELAERISTLEAALASVGPISVERGPDGLSLVIFLGDLDITVNADGPDGLVQASGLAAIGRFAEAAQDAAGPLIARLREDEGLLRDMAEDGKAVETMRALREENRALKVENEFLLRDVSRWPSPLPEPPAEPAYYRTSFTDHT